MGQNVRIKYLSVLNTHRTASGEIDDRFPTLVHNKSDGDLRHTVTEGAVIEVMKPVRVESFEDLLEMPTPAIIPEGKDPMILCEAGAYYPVSRNPVPDLDRREFERWTVHRQMVQQARATASKSNDRQKNILFLSLVCGFAVAVFTVIFAIIALSVWWESRSAGQPPPDPAARSSEVPHYGHHFGAIVLGKPLPVERPAEGGLPT